MAPPSPSDGQHVQAGKGAGFKFENPGDRGGVGRGTELQCAGAGGGGADPLLRSRVRALAGLPSAPVCPYWASASYCHEGE